MNDLVIWLRIYTRYEVMKGSCVCIYVFRVIPTDRIFSTESLCTDIYIHRNYMNNLFFQRAYHIIFIRDSSEVWKLFVKSSYIATRYRDVTCHNPRILFFFSFSSSPPPFLRQIVSFFIIVFEQKKKGTHAVFTCFLSSDSRRENGKLRAFQMSLKMNEMED